MEGLASKTLETSRGFTYRYYVSDTSQKEQLPPLVLLHGFRDFASGWRDLIPHLLSCRFVILDLLGHGDTSKPTDPNCYAYHLMVQDILEILDAEKIGKFISVGHDHGAPLAQRLYHHAPDRVAALILLAVAYNPPARKPFNLFDTNALTKQVFGYGCQEYFHFLTSPDAARLLNNNLDRAYDIPHTNDFADMRDLYASPNGMRTYLSDPTKPTVRRKPYATEERKELWKAEIQKGGLEAPLCWYTAMVQQVQYESDKLIPDERVRVEVPTLFIGGSADAPCRAELIEPPRQAGLLPHLTVHVLEGVGHFPMYEQPVRTAELILAFLKAQLGWTQ